MNSFKKPAIYFMQFTFFIMLSFSLVSCGTNPDTAETTAISFTLEWERPFDLADRKVLLAATSDVCVDYGLATVTATVKDAANKSVASATWPCSQHSGSMAGVPVGNNMLFQIEGKNNSSTVLWRGQVTSLNLTGGQPHNTGPVTMTYIGSDTTRPTVVSTNPTTNAVNVASGSSIFATFSESMAASTINETTFTVKAGTTSIAGIVTYTDASKMATFAPSSELAYSTQYTATITVGAKDMALNGIASSYSWSFTTENAPVTLPATPANISISPGNGQILISWDAVSGATSYNIFWANSAGVTKAGTKIQTSNTTLIHSGLTNGTKYYYVVSAANVGAGESALSAEVSATPSATPPPPLP